MNTNLGGVSHPHNILQSSPFPKQQTSPVQIDELPSLSPGELEDHYKNLHSHHNVQHHHSNNNLMVFQTPTHKKLQIEVNSADKRNSSGQHVHLPIHPHHVLGGRKDSHAAYNSRN